MKPKASIAFVVAAISAVALSVSSPAAALTKKQIQTERNRFADGCRLSGGTVSGSGSHIGCCWANWGCLYCDIGKDSCQVICDTKACERGNFGKSGNLRPGDVKPTGPRTIRPSAPEVGPMKKDQ
jgi:hypothetical protein